MLDRLVGCVVRRFEFAFGSVLGVGLMMETTVGQGSAETFVEEQEQQRDLHAFGSEPIGVSTAITLE